MKSLFKRKPARNDSELLRFTISRMRLEPGDVIVLRHPGTLSATTVDRLQEIAREALGGRKCLVLEQGMDIGVLSNTEIERQLNRTTEAA